MLFRRKRNRRLVATPGRPAPSMRSTLAAFARRLLAVLKLAAVAAAVVGAVFAADCGVRHVVASPRFQVQDIRVSPTAHVSTEELLALGGVKIGDRLLSLDADRVAARVAAHPWIASAHVRRELPGALVIDVSERRPAAVALMGALYLVDDGGRPFKRAGADEGDGLPVLTGVTREQYAGQRAVAEAAFREAVAVAAAYRVRPARPPLAEVAIDPSFGFTLTLEGGAEVRLGRGPQAVMAARLGRLDPILDELGPAGVGALEIVHLEDVEPGAERDRIPVRLAAAEPEPEAAPRAPKSRR